MTSRVRQLTVAGLVLVLAGAGWALRPTEESRVRRVVTSAAAAATFAGNEGALGRLTKAAEVAALCTDDFSMRIELLGGRTGGLSGRDQVRQLVTAAATECGSYQIRIHDLGIRAITGDEARVEVTVSTTGCGQRDFDAQEFEIRLRRQGTSWRMASVRSVRAFTK